MNYAFNYGFDGSAERIHYSQGRFAGHVLVENDLREVLPFPLEAVGYLTKAPFHFALRADGERTLIDWDRSGSFDAGPVRADINTSYSTDDDPEKVNQNLRIIRSALGAETLLYMNQVHGKGVHVVPRDGPPVPPEGITADAMITDRPGVALMVKQADCQGPPRYRPWRGRSAAS